MEKQENQEIQKTTENIQVEKAAVDEGVRALELCIDHDHITISVTRFEELIKAEVSLCIAKQIFKKTESYNLIPTLSFLLGPHEGNGDENA